MSVTAEEWVRHPYWPECRAVVVIDGVQAAPCDHDQGHDGPHCNGREMWNGPQ